jgi:hypothetical protein
MHHLLEKTMVGLTGDDVFFILTIHYYDLALQSHGSFYCSNSRIFYSYYSLLRSGIVVTQPHFTVATD